MTGTIFDCFNLFPTPKPATDLLSESGLSGEPVRVSESDSSFENQIFDTVNQHRTSLRLPPLRLVPEISRTAREHSLWMCREEVWEGEICHTGSKDRGAHLMSLGFDFIRENVATAQVSEYRYRNLENRRSTADVILAHWIASTKGHRESIEERESTHTGIGVVSREFQDEDGDEWILIYVTQLFGR